MNKEVKSVSIRCEDNLEALVFDRFAWEDGEGWYEFSIKDEYLGGSGYRGFFGRLRRAWNAFFEKPVCYASVLVDDKHRVTQFLTECLDIVRSNDDKIGV